MCMKPVSNLPLVYGVDSLVQTVRSNNNMKRIAKAWRNLVQYARTIKERRKRRKKEKQDNPYIYPLF